MTTRKSISPTCFFLITLLSASITGSAQTPLSATKRLSVQTPEILTPASSLSQAASQTNLKSSENAVADSGFGSLNGRVLYDKIPGLGLRDADPTAVAGVKVMLRSVDGGMGAFFFDRLSRPDGTYDFQFVRPGRYSLEIDRADLPVGRRIVFFDVSASMPNHVDLFIEPQRTITGIVFVDVNDDGIYKPGKDQPVNGAYVSANGRFAVTDVNGSYVLRDLPAGRIGLLVSSPSKNLNTHTVLDLGTGPLANRVVNVPTNQ